LLFWFFFTVVTATLPSLPPFCFCTNMIHTKWCWCSSIYSLCSHPFPRPPSLSLLSLIILLCV
jgi:hypothetical protein